MPQINILDRSVYELIAAGEVIERPASIVKELIENSMDAGATQITVEIKNGGRTYIRVTDNGCGISREDVPKAFLRHATSKVSSKDDLDRILTLGFRGEALASVCAVSKTEMFTRTAEEDTGTHYAVNGGEPALTEESGCPAGTSIIVRDLFYNVPARLKFLKKDAAEANRVQELMTRLAVSRPDIAVKLIRDNKTVFAAAGDGKLFSAIYSVFGREFANTLLPVRYEKEGFAAEGFVSKPIASRPNRKLQVFYVNDRYVRSEVCSQALEEAYRNIMMVGKFPCCVLKLTVAPEIVDVNVHPAKTEIRFSDNRYVYDSVYFAVRQGLEEKDKPLELRVDSEKHFDSRELYAPPAEKPAEQMMFAVKGMNTAPDDEKELMPSREEDGTDLFLNSLSRAMEETPAGKFFAPERGELPEPEPLPPSRDEDAKGGEGLADESFIRLCESFEGAGAGMEEAPAEVPQDNDGNSVTEVSAPDSAAPSENVPEEKRGEQFVFVDTSRPVKIAPNFGGDEPRDDEPIRLIGELFKTYIVIERGDSLILIDKHAAHERHIYEGLKSSRRLLSSQTLLEPLMIVLSFDEYEVISANLDKLAKLGFIIEPDVAPSIAVLGLPEIISGHDPTDLITEIAGKLMAGDGTAAPEMYDDALKSMSCRAAIKAHDTNTPEELLRLAKLVFKEDLRYCPHGRPIVLKMTEREIEKHFRRIV